MKNKRKKASFCEAHKKVQRTKNESLKIFTSGSTKTAKNLCNFFNTGYFPISMKNVLYNFYKFYTFMYRFYLSFTNLFLIKSIQKIRFWQKLSSLTD